ncbi:recombinase family protein [Tepidibacter sp. Z1-5]|uniref:recombinase family protein n=1 Tax=Tepidibacter sp. Z1-5 TaxID=3134138 RepID=UPI0030BCAC03
MNIAIYSRKSKFTGKGESIKNQIERCKDYARHNYDVENISIYEDEGFSGGNMDRPKFKQMIKDAKSKKFDILICYKLDRISRNISNFSDLIELLEKNNISFISISESFDTSTPMGRAMMYIASVFAQLERETIAERVRDNMHYLARFGRWLGGICPTGFKSEPIIYVDDNMKERKMYKLTPIEKELDTIKLLYDNYLKFKSLSKLETYCLRNNIKSKTGKDFQKSTLSDILSNPVYAVADEYVYNYFELNNADIASSKCDFDGKYAVISYNKKLVKKEVTKRKDISDWIIAIGKHKGIISGKDWVEVQSIMKSNKVKIPRKGSSTKALLSGLIKCGNCGSFFRVGYGSIKKDGERYYYYRCNIKDLSRGDRCNIKNLPGEKTDKLVLDKISSIILPRVLSSISESEKNIKDNLTKARKIKNQISSNKKSIQNLVMKLSETEDESVSKYILAEIKRLDVENNNLERKLSEDNNDDKKFNLELLKEKLINFSKMMDNVTFEEKQSLVKSIIKRIEWDGSELKIIVYNI